MGGNISPLATTISYLGGMLGFDAKTTHQFWEAAEKKGSPAQIYRRLCELYNIGSQDLV